MEKTGVIRDMTMGSVTRQLVMFTLPLFFSNLLQVAYNIVDMIVVGQYVGSIGLSAVSIGSDVMSFLTFVAIGFANAEQVIVAQLIGAKQREKLHGFIGTSITTMVLFALLLSAACLFLREPIVDVLNTPFEAREYTISYITVCMVGLVFTYGYNIVAAILRGVGDSKRPFYFITISSVINVVLDLFFIIVLGLEVMGVALATAIAQGVSCLCAFGYLYRQREKFDIDFRPAGFKIQHEPLLLLLKLGLPMALQSGAVMFSKLFVGSFVNAYGVAVSAVTGTGNKIDSIVVLFTGAVRVGASTMIGQCIGAEKYKRISRILGAAIKINVMITALFVACIIGLPREIFGLFITEPDVLLVALTFVPVAVVSMVGSAFRNTMVALINGSGCYWLNLLVGLLDGVILRIGLALLLGIVFDMGYLGFWYGNVLAGYGPVLIGAIYYFSGRWKTRKYLISATKEDTTKGAK